MLRWKEDLIAHYQRKGFPDSVARDEALRGEVLSTNQVAALK